MLSVQMMQMAIVQVVDMIPVLDRGVTTVVSMGVLMIGVLFAAHLSHLLR